MPDPKVEAAIEEIKALVRKHDLAAVVFVASPTHTNFLYEVCPSWTCARLEQDNAAELCLRIRSKLVDYPSKDAQKKDVERTFGMFLGFAQACFNAHGQFTGLVKQCAGMMTIEHWDRLEIPPRNKS